MVLDSSEHLGVPPVARPTARGVERFENGAFDETDATAFAQVLIGTPARLPLDVAVLIAATVFGITVSALLLPRLAR